jgi:excisionase family DNA binding protein
MSVNDDMLDVETLEDLGSQGFQRYGRIVDDEFDPNLQGSKAMRMWREMGDNDPLIGGALRGMKLLIRQAPWVPKPADVKKAVEAGYGTKESCEREANSWKDRLEESMYDMEVSWRQIVDELMSAFQYGFCLMWIKYKIRRGDNQSKYFNSQFDDGLWGWRSWEIRRQDTIEGWIYDETDETLVAAEQLAPPNYKLAKLPMHRLIHLRFETSGGNPMGRSGLRNSYRPYFFGNKKEEIEGVGIYRDLVGYPVMEVPQRIMSKAANADEKATRTYLFDVVRKIKRDQLEGALIPSEDNPDGTKTGFKFRLMSSGGSRAIDIDKSIVRNRIDKLIPLLWEFALLGNLETGSRAVASDKTTMTAIALGALMDMIVETVNNSAVARWCRLNNVPRMLWPELSHGDIEKENILEWINSVAAAANGGLIVATDKDEEEARERLGLSQRAPEDTVLPQPQNGQDMFGGSYSLQPVEQIDDEDDIEDNDESEEEVSEMMTVEEAEKKWGVPRKKIMRAIRTGKFPGGKMGNTYLIPREEAKLFFSQTNT